MTTRNPMKDKVAVVGLGATKYSRDARRSWTSLALEAAIMAIKDAGLKKEDIDGLSGRGPGFGHQPAGFLDIHEALGLGSRLAVGLVYWYDAYKVDDFALGPVASLAQPATATPALMMLGYFYKPYTANTVMARLTYLW